MQHHKAKPANRWHGGGLRDHVCASKQNSPEDTKSRPETQQFSRVYVLDGGLAALFPTIAAARSYHREAAR